MAHVQHTSQRVASGANALAFTSSNTSGNLLWGYVMIEDGTSTITSVIDSANGAWTAIGTIKRSSGSAGSLQLFYRKNCAAGANTVTVTMSAGSTTIGIHEESGYDTADPLGDVNYTEGFTTSTALSGTLTTTTASEKVIAAVVANRPLTVGSGYDLRVSEDFNLTSLSEDKVAGAAGAYTATATLSIVGSWIVCAATLRVTSGGSGSTPPTPPVTHRDTITEPTLPTMGAAGYTFVDPSFGSPMGRLTDANTIVAEANHSFTTPSASHQKCISKNGTRIYVISDAGEKISMTYDAATMQAVAGVSIASTGADPQFSYRDNDVIFCAGQNGSNHPVIKSYNFATATYTTLLDLDTVATLVGPEIYCGTIMSTKSAPEQLMVMFGGNEQDAHYLAAVFQVSNPAICTVVDTLANTISINGAAPVATNIALNFKQHHVQIFLGGAGAIVEVTSAYSPPLAPKFYWNLQTNDFAPISVLSAAHSCCSYDAWINMDGPTEGFADNRPYPQIRSMPAEIASPRALVRDPFAPTAIYLDGHISHHNASATEAKDIVMENYRSQDGPNDSPANVCAWKAWDDEIISVQTIGSGTNTTVKRWCHFRSNVREDGDANSAQYFYYQPRVNVSDDGLFALFTSNWEKTLGAERTSGRSRHDVFVVKLAAAPVVPTSQNINFLISLGIGTPGDIKHFVLTGLSPDAQLEGSSQMITLGIGTPGGITPFILFGFSLVPELPTTFRPIWAQFANTFLNPKEP